MKNAQLKVLNIGLMAIFASGLANAQQATDTTAKPTTLDEVVIKGRAPADTAKAVLNEVPGNASVVSSEELSRGRNTTLGDVLAYQPGVFVQAVGGNDAVKISIRGSGIVNTPGFFREGIKFMYDGLALTGTGGTSYELLNASGVAYTEVLRGGNAFDYGALAVGGGVNFVTHTGYTAPGTILRQEVGSWGLSKTVVSTGGVNGDFDYYVNADNYTSTGYRDWSASESRGIVANLGFKISPQLQSRLLVRYREEYHQDPGTLTLTELNQNPKQASPTSLSNKASGTRHGSWWVGNKTNYVFDDGSTIEGGIAYYAYPHENNRDNRVGNPGFWDWADLNTSLRYARTDNWGGHESRSNISYTGTEHLIGSQLTRLGPNPGITVGRASYKDSHDITLSVGNDLEVSQGLWFTSGVAAVHVRRHVVITNTSANANPQSTDYQNLSYAPRFGLRYQIQPELQVFGNFTRSIDPPLDWRYASTATGLITPLREQRADTLEAGIKGAVGAFNGSVAVFRTNVQNDLLTVVDEAQTAAQGITVTRTFNSDTPTVRQGLEVALDAQLWKNAGDQVVLRQAYTWNDFHFVNDPRLGSNRLPGVPQQVYQAKLQYDQAGGFYGNLNVQAASTTSIDYTDTAYAPGYAIWGITAGYESPSKKWKAYVDLKNIGDIKYVATAGNSYDVKGAQAATRTYLPGDGFGVFAGGEFRF